MRALGRQLLIGLLAAALGGCIGKVNPEAKPVTDVNPAQATPAYWWKRPAVVHVDDRDFDRLWTACSQAVKDRLFTLDRQDYREGLLTTYPMVSKQAFEFWRSDAVTCGDIGQSSLATTRRTVRFEFARQENGTYAVTPKVLVEHFASAERRITTAVQYQSILSGGQLPGTPERDVGIYLPQMYWYATGRDAALEKSLANSIRDRLQ